MYSITEYMARKHSQIAGVLHKPVTTYRYKTLSWQPFDANYSSLGLLVAKIHLFFFVYRIIFSVICLYSKSKGFVEIHKT